MTEAQAFGANLVQFGRALRRVGLGVTPEQTRLFASAIRLLGVDRRGDVRTAGRAVFTRSADEGPVYDAAFDLFWRRSTGVGGTSGRLPRLRQRTRDPLPFGGDAGAESGPGPTDVVDSPRRAASAAERLRTADFAELTAVEAREAWAMIADLRPRLPLRPSRRRAIGRRGERLAARLLARRSLATGGEPLDWRWLRRRKRPRPIVLVADISGSMEAYSRFLLRFAHALGRTGAPVEVFVFGTRLTRITRELRHRNPDEAIRRAAGRVVDWSGGTRIGASLAELNRRWVRRTVRSGAVVLIVSDGWERDDPALLAREMATLRRSCHRLVWLDPLAGQPGFEPVTAGLRAALPHTDAFLPCGTLGSLVELAKGLSLVGGLRNGFRDGVLPQSAPRTRRA